MKKIILMIWFFVFSISSLANTGDKKSLNFFKTLEGDWTIKTGEKTAPIKMTYNIGSKGNIVSEQFGKELSVFSKNGDSLLMTHFCNRGIQTRLKLAKNKSSNTLEFRAFETLNRPKSSNAHIDRIIYRVVSDSLLKLEIVWKNENKESPENYDLLRI